jgi:hypothetical protein
VPGDATTQPALAPETDETTESLVAAERERERREEEAGDRIEEARQRILAGDDPTEDEDDLEEPAPEPTPDEGAGEGDDDGASEELTEAENAALRRAYKRSPEKIEAIKRLPKDLRDDAVGAIVEAWGSIDRRFGELGGQAGRAARAGDPTEDQQAQDPSTPSGEASGPSATQAGDPGGVTLPDELARELSATREAIAEEHGEEIADLFVDRIAGPIVQRQILGNQERALEAMGNTAETFFGFAENHESFGSGFTDMVTPEQQAARKEVFNNALGFVVSGAAPSFTKALHSARAAYLAEHSSTNGARPGTDPPARRRRTPVLRQRDTGGRFTQDENRSPEDRAADAIEAKRQEILQRRGSG